MIHKLLKRPQAIIGLCLIAIVIVIAIAAPAFSPHDPELVNLSQKYAQPDAEYPLGTDQLGRCTLSRLLYGARYSIGISLPVLLILSVIGLIVGTFSACAGEKADHFITIGQSGSGKTMTCSAVLNLLDPKKFKVSGSIFFGETDLLNSSEKQRRGIYGNQIVYIPQNPMTALDPSMRIGRQMDETLRLHSDKSRQQRYNYILRLLHDVGLDDPDRVYRAYPHMLSGGMLQRVIIAMAMMLDAKFVLADEPTTALDVIHRNGIIDLFSQMKANGVGIFMVTHDFATALQLGGNVLVMKEGKIIESGEVQSVFDHTTEPYTRSLIEAYSLSCAFTKGAES